MCDQENLEYVLRKHLNMRGEEIAKYPIDKAIRMARRAWIEASLGRLDTYLRPLSENMNRKIDLDNIQSKAKHKVVFPKTWK